MFSCCSVQSNAEAQHTLVYAQDGMEIIRSAEVLAFKHDSDLTIPVELPNGWENNSSMSGAMLMNDNTPTSSSASYDDPQQRKAELEDEGAHEETSRMSTATKPRSNDPISNVSQNEFSSESKNEVMEVNESTISPSGRIRSLLPAPELTDGAYLSYRETKNGSFYLLWRNQPPQNLIAYAKQGLYISIPPFKYNQETELHKYSNMDSRAPLLSVLQYFRSIKRFKCSVTFLDISDDVFSMIPQMIAVVHHLNGQMDVVVPNGPMIPIGTMDSVAVVLMNTPGEISLRALAEQKKVDLRKFELTCQENRGDVEFTTFSFLIGG